MRDRDDDDEDDHARSVCMCVCVCTMGEWVKVPGRPRKFSAGIYRGGLRSVV